MGDDRVECTDLADVGPGAYTGPEGWPGPVLRTVDVEGEIFAIRRSHDGESHYDWVSGRNAGYGFSSSADPDQPDEMHRRSIRGFLSMIDPATGYIAED
jgi:hypothetical protein